MTAKERCPWPGTDPLYVDYHDREWGVPDYDDGRLFAKLILDGAQAGLSWITILRKREGYYRAFAGFDPQKMARFDERRTFRLLEDPGIVRNRAKIGAAIENARAYLRLTESGESFSELLWRVVDGRPRHNHWRSTQELPAKTPESEAMSRLLRDRGFRFVGPTICYAFMQAVGMVNDHLVTCFRHAELRENHRGM